MQEDEEARRHAEGLVAALYGQAGGRPEAPASALGIPGAGSSPSSPGTGDGAPPATASRSAAVAALCEAAGRSAAAAARRGGPSSPRRAAAPLALSPRTRSPLSRGGMAAAERRTVAAERISTWTRQKITVVPMVSKGGAAAERMGCKAAAAAPAAGAGVLQLSSAPSGPFCQPSPPRPQAGAPPEWAARRGPAPPKAPPRPGRLSPRLAATAAEPVVAMDAAPAAREASTDGSPVPSPRQRQQWSPRTPQATAVAEGKAPLSPRLASPHRSRRKAEVGKPMEQYVRAEVLRHGLQALARHREEKGPGSPYPRGNGPLCNPPSPHAAGADSPRGGRGNLRDATNALSPRLSL